MARRNYATTPRRGGAAAGVPDVEGGQIRQAGRLGAPLPDETKKPDTARVGVNQLFGVAIRAGIQKKVSHRVFKLRSHAVRHYQEHPDYEQVRASTPAEHVLGHAPRDAYEKQAILYPEMIRAEYAKASSRLNIFSKVESNLNSPEDPESMEAQITGSEGGGCSVETIEDRRGLY